MRWSVRLRFLVYNTYVHNTNKRSLVHILLTFVQSSMVSICCHYPSILLLLHQTKLWHHPHLPVLFHSLEAPLCQQSIPHYLQHHIHHIQTTWSPAMQQPVYGIWPDKLIHNLIYLPLISHRISPHRYTVSIEPSLPFNILTFQVQMYHTDKPGLKPVLCSYVHTKVARLEKYINSCKKTALANTD